ncbi:MAG: FHA domain-containing protein [Lachnospiraceae bacterium]|nr:FHA domain-containing protein [Lachnospiraceae bacterium]
MSNTFNSNMYVTVFESGSKVRDIKLEGLGKEVVSFGRAEDCDIVINSKYASRLHGCFYMENGFCYVRDLDSKNGIICSGKKIKERRLSDGSYIRITDENHDDGVLLIFSILSEPYVWNSVSLKDRITIGRDAANDICLNHVSVSKRHAIIEKKSDGYYISDNNSTNGVMLNGKMVRGKVKLHNNDMMLITNTKMVFTGNELRFTQAKKGISLKATDVVKKVGKNNYTICDHVTLNINPGELVAIVGGSGAGKTTIMNLISGYNVPTSGEILVNDINLYENFDALKHIIGYVPQQDIVYDNLSVYTMLKYSAKLRLPRDVGNEEIDSIVNHVIDVVDLSKRKDTLVKQLSGGQRKRASIAVELLSNPNLFFLDEPASGLDPGTERSLIRTLKEMTISGKTVILVTHSTLNLKDFDRIIFMGTGGKLCFSGTYEDALRFFETDDIVNIYEMIGNSPDKWRNKFKSVSDGKINIKTETKLNKGRKRGIFNQLGVLSKRYINILLNDRQRMMLLLLQAPLLAVLISVVADGREFERYEMTKSLLFALSCSAFWIGILSSIQEVCKERNILKREYMTGLSLIAYIVSKILVLSLLCLIQTLLIVGTFAVTVGVPDEGVMMSPFLEITITTLLTSMAAAAIGIFVSSLFTNADRAMTVAPILLMPQILFSGMIFKLDGATEVISYFAVCRWSMEGYGSTANLNALENNMMAEGLIKEREIEDFYKYTKGHLFKSWGILLLFVVICMILAGIVLRNVKKNK